MLRSKFLKSTEDILLRDFRYPVNSMFRPVLKEVCRVARRLGQNEYRAAINFMLVQINSISTDNKSAPSFVKVQIQNIRSVMSLAGWGYDEIDEVIDAFEYKFGLKTGSDFLAENVSDIQTRIDQISKNVLNINEDLIQKNNNIHIYESENQELKKELEILKDENNRLNKELKILKEKNKNKRRKVNGYWVD